MDKIEELKIEIPKGKQNFLRAPKILIKRENDEEETLNPNKSKNSDTTSNI